MSGWSVRVAARNHAGDQRSQVLRLKWLCENRIGPQFCRHLEIQCVRAAPGHRDDLQFAVVLAYPPDGFYAVGTGHQNVREEQVHPVVLQHLLNARAAARFDDHVPVSLEDRPHGLADEIIIIEDKNAGHASVSAIVGEGRGPATLAGLSPYSLPTPERELQLGNMVLLNIQ